MDYVLTYATDRIVTASYDMFSRLEYLLFLPVRRSRKRTCQKG